MPIVTIPNEHYLRRENGTLVLGLAAASAPADAHILTTGAFSLWYKAGAFVLRTDAVNPTKQIALYTNPFPGEVILVWTWINNNHRLIAYGSETRHVRAEASALKEDFGVIVLSNTPYFPGEYLSLETYAQDCFYEANLTTALANIRSGGERLFSADYSQVRHYAEAPFFEVPNAPLDDSPILVETATAPLKRQFFFDLETGGYTTKNKEHFVYLGEDSLFLTYKDLETSFLPIVECEEEIVTTNIQIVENELMLALSAEEKERWYGKTFTVSYELANSYTLSYEDYGIHHGYRMTLPTHTNEKIFVTQENSLLPERRLAKEVELNPLASSQHTGFLYLSKEAQTTQAFRLNVSSEYLVADGLDSADFIVEAIDKDGNEVLSPYIDVFLMDETGKKSTSLGELVPVLSLDTLKARISAGRCYFRYKAPLIKSEKEPEMQKVYLVAYDRKAGIGSQRTLYLRPSETVPYGNKTASVETSAFAALPFEYAARLYERALPEGHPLLNFDTDNDGYFSYQDFRSFLEKEADDVLMQQVTDELEKKEVF